MPWYKNKTILKRCLYNLNKFVSNPFISPLLASEQMLEQLEQMPLYLYPLLYDAFLDDSIEMAKKWKGKLNNFDRFFDYKFCLKSQPRFTLKLLKIFHMVS